MAVEIGWSKDPNAGTGWKGGEVSGIIAPDSRSRMRLVSATGLGGLAASKPPSPDSSPTTICPTPCNGSCSPALRSLIYVLALRKKWLEGGQAMTAMR